MRDEEKGKNERGNPIRRSMSQRTKFPRSFWWFNRPHPDDLRAYVAQSAVATSLCDNSEKSRHEFGDDEARISLLYDFGDGASVRTYQPAFFKWIRHTHAHISNEQWRQSWSKPFNCSSASAGKSGAIFSESHDRLFLLKTLTEGEVRALNEVLSSLVEHFAANPGSLINKPLGLFTLQARGAMHHFVAVENVVGACEVALPSKLSEEPHVTSDPSGNPSPVDDAKSINGKSSRRLSCSSSASKKLVLTRLFDLKGSIQGRFVKTAGPTDSRTIVFKDGDWMAQQKKVTVAEKLKIKIGGIIERDASFLHDMGIMDYSLLVGECEGPGTQGKTRRAGASSIAAKALNRSSRRLSVSVLNGSVASHSSSSRNCRRRASLLDKQLGASSIGGLVVAGQGSTFVLGIIDYLQDYNTKKKLANAAKSILCDSNAISTIPPREYCDRFVRFCKDSVLDAIESDSRTPSVHPTSTPKEQPGMPSPALPPTGLSSPHLSPTPKVQPEASPANHLPTSPMPTSKAPLQALTGHASQQPLSLFKPAHVISASPPDRSAAHTHSSDKQRPTKRGQPQKPPSSSHPPAKPAKPLSKSVSASSVPVPSAASVASRAPVKKPATRVGGKKAGRGGGGLKR
ncbi:hypothetical protein DIPPA_58769 [Diplonema papillatum]|nr:hypothetical protein DIPPA_58769 [Diplonema papillatum]